MPSLIARSILVIAVGTTSIPCSAADDLQCEAGAPACHATLEEDDTSAMQLKSPAQHKTVKMAPQVQHAHSKGEWTWEPVDGGAGRACRGEGGTDDESVKTVRSGLDNDACRVLCSGMDNCTGVKMSRSSCELWHVPILTSEDNTDFSCYRKGMALVEEASGNWTGYGQYWELVNSDSIASTLPYLRSNSGAPWCMQGLVWMDQQCTTYWSLPWNYGCRTALGIMNENEYTTSFSNWNPQTKCVSFGRAAWTFGDPKKAPEICRTGDPSFCQSNSDTKGPCDEGAYFKYGGYHLVKTSFGWDRKTKTSLGVSFHYPLFSIVDGNGVKTKYFSKYLKEVTQRRCSLDNLICRKSHWASSRKIARCTRAASR